MLVEIAVLYLCLGVLVVTGVTVTTVCVYDQCCISYTDAMYFMRSVVYSGTPLVRSAVHSAVHSGTPSDAGCPTDAMHAQHTDGETLYTISLDV
jgi:hypothetical protein